MQIANWVLSALPHLINIVDHMHQTGGFPDMEVQELETLHKNMRTIYGLILQLSVSMVSHIACR